MTRLLFLCGRGRQRSPTAEQVFGHFAGVETRSAGVSSDADEPLSAEDVAWADVIFVMERPQQAKLKRAFNTALRGKRVVCLNIADEYDYMDATLVGLLRQRVPRSVPALRGGPL